MLSGYEHLFGGLSGGIASTLICHPLDLLRIRYAGLCARATSYKASKDAACIQPTKETQNGRSIVAIGMRFEQ